MLSVFQSREWGFGFGELTAEELALVNCRQNGQQYRDEAAAKLINLTPVKPDLKENPFYVEFEYGVSKEGYWTYDRMVLQLEDCIDVLQVLHPQYDYVFLFDHSCGHDRQRPDGLNPHTLNKGFGGGQTKMRSSKILIAAGFLGQYEHPQKLKVGDNQQLVFLTLDQEGPFYLSTEQRAAKMNSKSRESENRTKVKSKTELLDELALKGVCPEDPKSLKKQEVLELAAHNDLQKSKQSGHNLKSKGELQEELKNIAGVQDRKLKRDFQNLASQNNVSIWKRAEDVEEGWLGKPKGMLQILWERGFIDPGIENPKKYYTLDRKNQEGEVEEGRSLRRLIRECYDFEHEHTLMQYVGAQLGVVIDWTPKCHCEMAGKGIE